MKQLMLGNKAVARGLYEAGCSFVSSYPGTPSTEITEEIAKYDDIYSEWAPNEKVAMEAAFGACLSGTRSFCGMKHVGLNVAADPLYTMSYTGVNAGMVIGVADDAGMHSSQNEQDSRRTARRPMSLRNWHMRSPNNLTPRFCSRCVPVWHTVSRSWSPVSVRNIRKLMKRTFRSTL